MNCLLLERKTGTNEITIESFIALALWKFLDTEEQIKVQLIEVDQTTSSVAININEISHENYRNNDEKKYIQLPMLKINDGNYNIIGLCSVLRGICRLMQSSSKTGSLATKLLGFKENCLLSASTSSLWVSFCEQDIIQCLINLTKTTDEIIEFPLQMLKLECEFKNPVRMHNIFKVVREAKKDRSIQSESATKVDLEHKYCHGNEANLSDFILYVIFKLIFLTVTNENEFENNIPHILKWYRNMDMEFSTLYDIIMMLLSKVPQKDIYFKEELPIVEANGKYFSLFKRQLIGHKMKKCKGFTNQNEIDLILSKLNGLNIDIKSEPGDENRNIIDDNIIEELLSSGEFPQERMDRKKSQLKSFTSEVIKIAHDDDIIVDFCSGTGHIGLLIALLLPNCKVIILENKEESIKRAIAKAKILKLNNVSYYQCNLEYFNEKFQIGCSLHACGIATDLVLEKCYKLMANFISSPCCYGKIQDLGNLPQSEIFRAVLSADDLIKIAHCSDQTHDEKNVKHINLDKARQGYFCMDIIDTDRSLRAQELGYTVQLTRLYPEDCTLKNRLLIGVYPR
ncbi:unnamed protein product [Chironomus riparius]|uniref:Methyltransferase domain-containing protein n=1 Tax=Chironomus riparius TaxID=315576 RepID=A0A9N9WPZ9_9DIPT|nr:unnamed protein product [Chironomus riparius]